jgi:spermidine synthase
MKTKTTILSLCLAVSTFCNASEWFTETLYPDWRQTFQIEEILYQEKTSLQDLVIFKNPTFGKVLALDGIVQLTEKDEFVYHEMISHVPILAHGNAKKVLVIGGGDGGTIREVLRHKTLERVVLVEIDESVIAFSKEHLPNLSKGAFDDPRLEVVVNDGAKYMKTSSEKFDVIIIDSCDPVGPAAVLFTEEFYADCSNRLTEDGIFVNQAGVPFMQTDELTTIYQNLKPSFKDVGFYLGVIPTYVGGYMTFGWATNNQEHRNVALEVLKERLNTIEGDFKYYTPSIHKAAFALPRFIERQLD